MVQIFFEGNRLQSRKEIIKTSNDAQILFVNAVDTVSNKRLRFTFSFAIFVDRKHEKGFPFTSNLIYNPKPR